MSNSILQCHCINITGTSGGISSFRDISISCTLPFVCLLHSCNLKETIHIYYVTKQCLKPEKILRQNVLLMRKVTFISQEIIIKRDKRQTYRCGQFAQHQCVCCKILRRWPSHKRRSTQRAIQGKFHRG